MDLLIIPIPVTQEKILHGILSLACSHSVDALQHFYGLSTALLWMPYSTSVDALQHFCGLSTALLWIIYSTSVDYLQHFKQPFMGVHEGRDRGSQPR